MRNVENLMGFLSTRTILNSGQEFETDAVRFLDESVFLMQLTLVFWSRISLFLWLNSVSTPSWIRFEKEKFTGTPLSPREIQGVHLTFEQLSNFARETFMPVWSLKKVFVSKNLFKKSLQKIRFENIQNRRPRGSSIKHGGFWDFLLCRASADDQSPDIPFRIR